MITLKDNPNLIGIIKKKLNTSNDARTMHDTPVMDLNVPIEVDLIIEDGPDKYFIEIKSKPRIDTVSRLVLLRELINKTETYNYRIHLVVASKAFSRMVEDIARKTDIELIELPRNLKLEEHRYYGGSRNVKITSEKAWRIITRLMKERITSIRQLSLKENVSYGWTHAVIQHLLNQEILSKNGNYVEISDIDKLLNGISWERPFENLIKSDMFLKYNNAHEAAREITYMLSGREIGFAFTSYTAGGLYTGYAARHDSLYLYLDRGNMKLFKEIFENYGNEGIKVKIYRPDRNVFTDNRKMEEINVVSPSQSLLDLAGLGYAGRNMAMEMVEKYGSL